MRYNAYMRGAGLGRVRVVAMATVKVDEALRRLERDGWFLVRTTGSHRHFRHATKPGTVTVPVHKLSATLPPGTWLSIQRQAGWR